MQMRDFCKGTVRRVSMSEKLWCGKVVLLIYGVSATSGVGIDVVNVKQSVSCMLHVMLLLNPKA